MVCYFSLIHSDDKYFVTDKIYKFMIVGVAEMLSMEMKHNGMYLSRGLSFQSAEVRFISMLNDVNVVVLL